METLHKHLESLKIHSERLLKSYLDSLTNQPDKYGYRLLTEKDLELDNEDRYYKPIVEFKKTVFKCDILRLANTFKMQFQDCIFLCSLRIGQKEVNPIELISFDCCIANEVILGGISKALKINISDLNTRTLSLINSHFDDCHISGSNVDQMILYNAHFEKLTTYFNRFYRMSVNDCRLPEIVAFDYRQIVNIPKMFRSKPPKRFSLIRFVSHSEVISAMEKEATLARESTISFILTKTNIGTDREALSKAKYIHTILTQPNAFFILFQRLLGGFIKPLRIVALSAVMLLLFTMDYMMPWSTFCLADENYPRALNFAEAAYYSGATFATIGGDISPMGNARAVSVAEAIIGIVLSSAFLVSLTRKYVE